MHAGCLHACTLQKFWIWIFNQNSLFWHRKDKIILKIWISMSGDHARVRACKVRMDMEACILLTRAFFWQVSNFLSSKLGPRGMFLWREAQDRPTYNTPKEAIKVQKGSTCTCAHFRSVIHSHERAGKTLEHELRLGFGPTPKSLFVSEIQTPEVARTSKSKFTL